jgi:hypothetical protein
MSKLMAGSVLLLLVAVSAVVMIPDVIDAIERHASSNAEARKAALSCQDGDTLICTRLYSGDCIAWRVCVPPMPGFGQ